MCFIIFSGKFRGGIDFRYNTYSRGCAQVDMNDWQRRINYLDGCHDNPPLASHVRKIIIQGYKGADVGSVKFKGRVCYNNDTFMAARPTKAPKKQTMSAASRMLFDNITIFIFSVFIFHGWTN